MDIKKFRNHIQRAINRAAEEYGFFETLHAEILKLDEHAKRAQEKQELQDVHQSLKNFIQAARYERKLNSLLNNVEKDLKQALKIIRNPEVVKRVSILLERIDIERKTILERSSRFAGTLGKELHRIEGDIKRHDRLAVKNDIKVALADLNKTIGWLNTLQTDLRNVMEIAR